MIKRKSPVTRVVGTVLLTLTACQDLPTAVVPAPPAPTPAARTAGGLHLGQSPLVCSLGRPAPAPAVGWQTRRDTIFVPRSDYQKSGQMVRYLFLQMARDGRVAFAASCTVPYSEAALRRVDRHFGVEKGGGADQFVVREGMLTTQSCVEDEDTGACVFDPLVVTAPPRENSDPCVARPNECTFKRTDAPDDGWTDPNDPWGGGGTDPNNGEEEEEEGVAAYAICMTIKMGVSGWGALFTTGVSAYMAWDARQNTRAKYNAWARYRQDVDGGFVRYDIHINDLYYNAWKDAEHQELLFYATTSASALFTAAEIFKAAAFCSPYILAPV